MKIFALLMCAGAAMAQSPGNGISKTTMACNDPIPGKTWLYKYFPLGTPGDECTDDICICPAGTGGDTEWYIQQGRVYTLESDTIADVAALRGRKMPDPGNGFGMHLVNVSNHLTTGGISVSKVESYFTEKLGDMSEFDAFLDFNAMFYTKALSDYVAAFDEDNVPMYKTTWKYEGTTWTSVFVHVPNSQLTIELCQDTELEDASETETHEISRLSPRAIEAAMNVTISASSKILTPMAVNRAVSTATMEKLEDFYVTGMKTELVDSSDTPTVNGGDSVAKKCFLWTGATVDVCFYARDESATSGDWKVSDFEDMLNTVHENILGKNPLCGTDKWFDNHYAIDSRTHDSSNIVPYIEENSVPHYCASQGPSGELSLHYVIDPTGWGIQLDLQFSSTPSDCEESNGVLLSSSATGGTFNPACEPGTCS